jgi:adhesin HecA-like repeat protein
MATNIRFQGLVKTTAEIESDKFAGRIGWNTTLARFVAYYNSTQYAQMARRDVLETFAAGLQDSTLGVGLPMFAGTAGRLSTESVANFRSRIGAVNKAGDTMTGSLTLSAGNLNVNAGAIQTAGVTRISAGGAGTLTTLSTTGIATFQSVNISGLTGSRMLSLDGSKNVQALDAAGSRALIGAQAELTNPVTGTGAAGRIAYWSSASKIASSGSLTYDGTVLRSGGPGPDIYGIVGVNRFAGNIDPASFTAPSFDGNLFGWNRTTGGRRTDFVSSVANPGHPHGFEWWSNKAGTLTSLAILRETGAFTLNSLAGTGNRLVQAGADGTQSASIPVPTAFAQTLFDDADQAAARATLGAQEALPAPAVYIAATHSGYGLGTVSSAEQNLFAPQSVPANMATSGGGGARHLRIVTMGTATSDSGGTATIRVKLNNVTVYSNTFTVSTKFILEIIITRASLIDGYVTSVLNREGTFTQSGETYITGLAFDSAQNFVVTSQGSNASSGISQLNYATVYSE